MVEGNVKWGQRGCEGWGELMGQWGQYCPVHLILCAHSCALFWLGHSLRFLLLWQTTMTKATSKRKHLIRGQLTASESGSMPIMAGSMAARRQALEQELRTYILSTSWRGRKKTERQSRQPGEGFWSLKLTPVTNLLQGHTSNPLLNSLRTIHIYEPVETILIHTPHPKVAWRQ